MDISYKQDDIKHICGTVSYKKGNSYYQANKVNIAYDSPDQCRATVVGAENFHVTIEKNAAAKFGMQTSCSCPKLASVKYACQHVAAVLLALLDKQQIATPGVLQTKGALSEDMLRLFHKPASLSSRYQRHFESRQLLDVVFLCKPVSVGKKQEMFGMEIMLESCQVRHIREFLMDVKNGVSSVIAKNFIYEPTRHCFQSETDDVIQQLIQVVQDEQMYDETTSHHANSHILPIPPSAWKKLMPLLSEAPNVKLMYDGKIFDGIYVLEQKLPLQFIFSDTANAYELEIRGMSQMKLLHAYHTVLYQGKLIQLKAAESKRLYELIQMLDASGSKQIAIAKHQIAYFLEKVVPGLKQMGDVALPDSITKQLVRTPLAAKLYLDRVNNRLLAGLEFDYGGIVFNPLQSQEQPASSMVVRDEAKEDAILQHMRDSAFTETESGYFMHNEALEYAFLYDRLPELEKLVQVYATTAVRNRIVKKGAHPRIRVKFKRERTNWLAFTFEMDGIADQQIKDILQAMKDKRKYYRLKSGSLLSLETKEFEEIRKFLRAAGAQEQDIEKGLNIPVVRGFRLLDIANETDIFQFEKSFREFLSKIQHPDASAFAVPKELQSVLRDYQKQGYQWMKILASYGFGGILADDMGLGKTLQSISFIVSNLSNIRKSKRPALIVCPSSLTYNWLHEINHFAPQMKAVVLDGKQIERIKLREKAMGKDVVITSYPLLRTDIGWYQKQPFHTVFFDEAQAFKNPITQTARAVKKVQADHRFALTGTPIENSLEELWSIFHVVFPELFQGLQEFSFLTRKKITRRIRPFLLRRTKADVLAELPKKHKSLESAELLPEQKKLYAAYLAKLREDTLKHLDQETFRKNRIRILAGLTRLRQICCHPALFVDGYQGGSAKFDQLMQILDEASIAGRRVLIFSQFTEMLKLIGKELAVRGRPFFYLDGHTPSEERLQKCDQFNRGVRDLFLISLKAGGTGLNLTGADTVILYDNWWNPAVEEQAADRAHRIGQQHDVEVIKLVARGTIEEKMNELQEKKRHLVAEVIDAEDTSGAMTEEDIRELLMV